MDLVFKQMGQQAQTTVVLRGVAGDGHDFAEVGVAHLLAVGDQPAVDVGLFANQVRCHEAGFVLLEKHPAIGMRVVAAQFALQGVHIKPVTGEDVVEGGADRGEEADPGCAQFLRAQLTPGLGQSVIGPGVLIGHGQQMV
ncbi:hypothetical protein D3C71_1028070 [compost metagenome]